MRKIIAFTLTFVFLALLSPVLRARAEENTAHPGVFRLHILANSDSPADQAVKLTVRDAVLALEEGMAHCADGAEAERVLMADGGKILQTVENTLQEKGFAYGAQLYVGEFDFPQREYQGVVYPAGKYRALRIILGNGNGHNWWCVMFPPLCILELPDGEIDMEQLTKKSWLIEWIKGIDGGKLWKRIEEKLR